MYVLFDQFRAKYATLSDEVVYDAILDTMDYIVGWCRAEDRLFPERGTPSLGHLVGTFVIPFYLRILHGNYVGELLVPENPKRAAFIRKAKEALAVITTGEAEQLFQDRNWRCRIVAAWFCGLKHWRHFSDTIGSLLIPSRQCYAGQGYCFALASFADSQSASHLCRYLDEYLTQPDKQYDQHWAMPALIWIDKHTGTTHSDRFLQPNGLWERMCRARESEPHALQQFCRRFDQMMNVTFETFAHD